MIDLWRTSCMSTLSRTTTWCVHKIKILLRLSHQKLLLLLSYQTLMLLLSYPNLESLVFCRWLLLLLLLFGNKIFSELNRVIDHLPCGFIFLFDHSNEGSLITQHLVLLRKRDFIDVICNLSFCSKFEETSVFNFVKMARSKIQVDWVFCDWVQLGGEA